jgi:hypothetical protein
MENANIIEILELRNIVDDIIEYTKTYSITDIEWYWNIACVRKPNSPDNTDITWDEFNVAIREEILYDLVYNNGLAIKNQMENDLYCYDLNYGTFEIDSLKLEKKIQSVLKEFKVKRYD